MAKKNKKPGKIRKTLGWAFKPFVNVKGWIAYDEVKNGYVNVKHTVSDIFKVAEAEHEESFEEACQRLNLNQTKLQNQYKNFSLMFKVTLLITILLLTLSIYWIFTGGIFSGFFVLLLSLIALANAARYHFWMYQIKNKKLGSSINEWLRSITNKRRP